MTSPATPGADEISLGEVLRPIVRRRRFIGRMTILAMGLAVLVGAAYYWLQPQRLSASIEFRPVFEGVAAGKYPNGLRFAPTDIVDASIVNEVFDGNNVQEFCARVDFGRSLTVDQASAELKFLSLEYQAQLADARLSSVERLRIQDEYATRRRSLPLQFSVNFIRPPACRRLPAALIAKILSDVLKTWAEQSERRRGVLQVNTTVLTPAVIDSAAAAGPSPLVRAETVRMAISRVITNVIVVLKLPGSQLVRLEHSGGSFPEVRDRLSDLMTTRLDPLIVGIGRSMGPEAVARVQQAKMFASVHLKATEQNEDTYRNALREYSGTAGTPPAPSTGAIRAPNPQDVQALAPQIDQTFIDRIVAMSGPNTAFRQRITDALVDAGLLKVQAQESVEQYTQLLEALKSPGGRTMSDAELAAQLTAVVAEAKQLTQNFNKIYEEFARVSLRPVPELYQVESPPSTLMLRAFGLRDFGLLVVAAGVVTLLLVAIWCLLEAHWRRLVVSNPNT